MGSKKKIFWFDVETSGTEPSMHAIIQFACIIEKGGEILGYLDEKIEPDEDQVWDEGAEDIHGISREELEGCQSQGEFYELLEGVLCDVVDKYDTEDKLWIAGYNHQYDTSFLRHLWFRYCPDKYGLGSYFNWRFIDPMYLANQIHYYNPDFRPPDGFSLESLADYLGVDLEDDAHDALADIKATREVYHKLEDRFDLPEKFG